MKLDLFGYEDYKHYVRDRVDNDSQHTKALRQKLAHYIECQPSYLSQVMKGKPHFTLEQAVRLNQFFGHDKVEAKYFVLLLEHSRAGTKDLREFFMDQIKDLQKSQFDLKKRMNNNEEVSSEDQHKYYSAWFYSAIHVILSIPEFQDPTEIARHFNLPPTLVNEAINFLQATGLVENKNGVFEFTKRQLHLTRDSVFIQRHHINWRSQALQSVEKNLREDLHYSNVLAVSKSDFIQLKAVLLQAIQDVNRIVKPSKEEALYAVTMDIFHL